MPFEAKSQLKDKDCEAVVKAAWLILGLSHVAVPAWGQEVTMSDLNGATVQYRGVYEETVTRNEKTYNPKIYQTSSVTIEENTVRSSFQVTAVHPDGRREVGPSRSFGPRTVGKAFKDKSGNDVVWIFTDGSLSRLIVHTAA